MVREGTVRHFICFALSIFLPVTTFADVVCEISEFTTPLAHSPGIETAILASIDSISVQKALGIPFLAQIDDVESYAPKTVGQAIDGLELVEPINARTTGLYQDLRELQIFATEESAFYTGPGVRIESIPVQIERVHGRFFVFSSSPRANQRTAIWLPERIIDRVYAVTNDQGEIVAIKIDFNTPPGVPPTPSIALTRSGEGWVVR